MYRVDGALLGEDKWVQGEGDATWLERSSSVAVPAAQSAVLYSIGMRKRTASRCIESGEWVVDGAV
jgi:hypothetical protein